MPTPLDPLVALVAILGLLALTGALALIVRKGSGRIRQLSSAEPVDVHDLGLERFGDAGTIVQFSTAYCSRCPATRSLLSGLADARPGVEFAHLDVTDSPELATKYRLLQTPTVVILNGRGVPTSRLTGVIDRRAVAKQLDLAHGGDHA